MKLIKYLLFLFFVYCHAEIRIVELKNYFIILDQQYKQCSPLEGMIWWEAGIVENLYRIGEPEDATTKLVKLLFHLHPDGTFDVTRPPQQSLNSGAAGAHFNAEIIAELIELLESHKTIEQIEKLKKTVTNKKFVQSFIKKYKDIFPADGKYEKNLQKIFRYLCESYIECSQDNEKASYIPFMTHRILLSYLWKKANTQKDLLTYITSLLKYKPIIRSEFIGNYQSLLQDSYDLNSLNNFFTKIASKNTPDLINDENYEITICSLFFYKPTGMLSHASGVTYKGHEFSNCGEVAFLNFFNQILYKNGEYDITLLDLPGIVVHSKLKNFYQKYRTPADMKTKQVHNDWAEVVSEIPGVAYRTGGTNPVFNEIDKTSICNMAGIGCQQLDKVFNFLLGLNSFADLPQLSRPDFKVNYTVQTPAVDQFKTYIISINDEPTMQWECTNGHFALKFIKQSQHNRLLPSTVIEELVNLPLREMPRACSLLTITQGSELFQKIITTQAPSTPLFTFSYLLPNITNAEDAVEFLSIIFNGYTKITEKIVPEINALLIRLYFNLPRDLHYARHFVYYVVQLKIEPLYEFILVEISSKLNSFDKQLLLSYIFKRALLTNNKELQTRLLKMYNDQFDTSLKTDLLSFIMFDGINSLKDEEKNEWRNFVAEEFNKLEKRHQANLGMLIIAKENSSWNFLLLEHLQSYNWKDYVPDPYERISPLNPAYIRPQRIFSHLLKTDTNNETTLWLMKHFNYMEDQNKSLALTLFKDLPEWNLWVKENFNILKPNKNSYAALHLQALKILIKQNNPMMKDFINTQVADLNFYLTPLFTFIIQNNHKDFFDLIINYFYKQGQFQQQETITNIIMYNRYYFRNFIEQYLEKADEIERKNVLTTIVSTKYRFKDGSIEFEPTKNNFFSDNTEKGILINNDDYYNWYSLVEKWLPHVNDYSALEIINSIEQNNIIPLEPVAQQRKSIVCKDIVN